MLEPLRRYGPGLALAATVAGFARLLDAGGFGAALIFALLLGMLVRPLVPIITVAVCAPALLRQGPLSFLRTPLLHARPRPDDWRRWLDHAGLSAVPVQKGATFESIALALEAAAMGLGAAIAIEALIANDLASGKVAVAHPVRRPTRRSFVLQADARNARDADLRAFADWLDTSLARTRQIDPG